MRYRVWNGLGMGVLLASFVSTAAAGQSGPANTPRTSWGTPDLQGVWDFRSLTPMERPDDLSENEIFSAEEAAEFAAETIRERSRDNDTSDRVVPYNDFWFDEGTVVTTERTSLVIAPPDGRIPTLTQEAQQRRAQLREVRVSSHEPTPGGFVEDLGPGGLQVRCILGFNSGPPMAPSAYNNNVQVFQTESTVVLFAEMNHNARIVPLDGSDHLDGTIPQWTGDSRGRWDEDTLVVETTNFLRETNFLQSSTTRNLTLIERFTRVDADTLQYDVTIDDQAVWTRPWTYSVPMKNNPEPVYEYACHEGNYGLTNILAGAAMEGS